MLSESARAVMGVPHPSGRAAMKMLEREGFAWDCYVDIFDGGPTMTCATDQIRTIRESQERVLAKIGEDGDEPGQATLVAAGELTGFACCWGRVRISEDGGAALDAKSAAALGLAPGDTFLAATR
jgi:arginine N-succinyltransferase